MPLDHRFIIERISMPGQVFLASDISVPRGAPPLTPILRIPAYLHKQLKGETSKLVGAKFWWSVAADHAHKFTLKTDAIDLLHALENDFARQEAFSIRQVFVKE